MDINIADNPTNRMSLSIAIIACGIKSLCYMTDNDISENIKKHALNRLKLAIHENAVWAPSHDKLKLYFDSWEDAEKKLKNGEKNELENQHNTIIDYPHEIIGLLLSIDFGATDYKNKRYINPMLVKNISSPILGLSEDWWAHMLSKYVVISS